MMSSQSAISTSRRWFRIRRGGHAQATRPRTVSKPHNHDATAVAAGETFQVGRLKSSWRCSFCMTCIRHVGFAMLDARRRVQVELQPHSYNSRTPFRFASMPPYSHPMQSSSSATLFFRAADNYATSSAHRRIDFTNVDSIAQEPARPLRAPIQRGVVLLRTESSCVC